jgi:inhibitor of KinA sporulation pathway (predicted exonuclease)
MKYIVLDLEATCWERRDKSPNEIIEIGALCVDENQVILGEFSQFVRPFVHTQLSKFCTELTSITQEQVDNALLFPDVLGTFQEWILSFEDDYVLCSWGHYDKHQFIMDCKLHGISSDWTDAHISLKHQYALINQTRSIGMKNALKREKLPLDGTHHRGIDDARNITKIFLKYFKEWQFGC